MVRIEASPELIKTHTDAVLNRVKTKGKEQEILAEVQKLGIDNIGDFLSADIQLMWDWVKNKPQNLQFTLFKEIYSRYFSNGADKYVYRDYNAYKYLEELGISVCPYCDDEYLDTVEINDRTRRTSEIDHFFPKSKYPALAMCFYNLTPSGQNCNGLKLEQELGMSPYESKIEKMTFLYPDIPVGAVFESLNPDDCKIKFHAQGGMFKNVSSLGLEQRYERHAPEAHRLLKNLQRYSEEKIEELVRLGCGTREEIISSNFGPQDLKEKKTALRQKMLRDLTGY